MSSPGHERAETIFGQAIAFSDAVARSEFLNHACAGEPALRAQVEELVQNYLRAGDFLERPPVPPGMTSGPLGMELPGASIGPYKLLQEIGEGGMGVVFMAEQTVPVNRRVALKIIKPGMDTRNVLARFEAERQALALMDHPNIAKVFDAGTTAAGRPYFVMELVRGVPITTYCDQHRLTPIERLALFLPVCQAVQHAHQKGIIHRDLKPSNVMIALYDGQPVPKIIDFGVAKATAAKLTEKTLFTELGQVVGTLEYMSPEQAQLNQLDIDTRTDIYSLGVLLYELLTGTTPLERKRLKAVAFDEMLRRIREEEPPKPSTRLSAVEALPSIAANRGLEPKKLSGLVRGDLDWIVMKALEKDRARRYETANGLASDIRHYLADEPVLACPPSARYRFGKFARRNRAALATVMLISLALAIGTAVSMRQAIRATRAEKTALAERSDAESQRLQAESSAERAKAEQENARRLLYRADMNLAERAWQDARVDQVSQLIAQHADDQDLQGFEWFYQRRLLNSDLRTLTGHENAVSSVAVSPQGRRLVSAADDGTIKLWDMDTGEALSTLRVSSKGVFSVAFSPNGRRFASAGSDRMVTVWDAGTGDVLRTISGHTAAVHSVKFSPDSERLASASADRTIKIWEAETGALQLTLSGHTNLVACVTFRADGKRLASTGEDGSIRQWDADTGAEIMSIKGHDIAVSYVAYSPDGSVLASAGHDGKIKLWNAETGDPQRTLLGHVDHVLCVEFSPDGREIASAGNDRTIRLWDAAAGTELRKLVGHAGYVSAISFAPDSRRLASASGDRTIKLWDCKAAGENRSLHGHANYVTAVTFSPDGRRIASSSKDQTIRLWDVETCELMRTLHESADIIASVAFSPDGRRLAAGNGDGSIKLWDAETGGELKKLAGHAFVVHGLAFSPDGKLLASASGDSLVKLWDVTSGDQLHTCRGHDSFVWSVAFSPDGRRLASASLDGAVILWDVATGAEQRRIASHANGVWSATFSPDSRRIASAGYDGTIKLWDADSGAAIHTLLGHTDRVLNATFSPDGRRVASASNDGTIKLWDADTGDELRTLQAAKQGVWSVTFSSDGSRLAAATGDETVKLWSSALLTPDQRTARYLVDRLAERLVLTDDLLTATRRIERWKEAMRTEAASYLGHRHRDPQVIYIRALDQLADTTAGAENWASAKWAAEALHRIDPQNDKYVHLLALAYFRAGSPSEMLNLLDANRNDQPAEKALRLLARLAREEPHATGETPEELRTAAGLSTIDADDERAKLRMILDEAIERRFESDDAAGKRP